MMKKFLFVLVAVCGLMACEGDGEKIVKLEPIESKVDLMLLPDTAHQVVFRVTSNTDWTIKSTSAFVNFDPKEGHGNDLVTALVYHNKGTKMRTSSLVLQSSDSTDVVTSICPIKQICMPKYLPEELVGLSIDQAGGVLNVQGINDTTVLYCYVMSAMGVVQNKYVKKDSAEFVLDRGIYDVKIPGGPIFPIEVTR